jgi:hypothetical protein
MTTIRVRISPAGRVAIDVIGGQGPSCSTLTATLQEALGPVAHESLKPEFVETQVTHHDTISH